jgi:hypothetical protein
MPADERGDRSQRPCVLSGPPEAAAQGHPGVGDARVAQRRVDQRVARTRDPWLPSVIRQLCRELTDVLRDASVRRLEQQQAAADA